MGEELEKVSTETQETAPEIFGQSKSRDEIKAEEKAAKAAKRAAEKEASKALRAQKKAMPKEKRTDVMVVAGILAAVVLLCGVALGVQFAKEKRAARFERNEKFESWFMDADATPELADDGVTAAVYQAYYTNGGYLAVEMVLGNGTKWEQHPEAISIKLSNGETEKVIADGKTTDVSESYTIPAGENKTYTLYISPEHVLIKDDPLSTISYSITVDAVAVDMEETAGSTTTTAGTTGTAGATITAADEK